MSASKRDFDDEDSHGNEDGDGGGSTGRGKRQKTNEFVELQCLSFREPFCSLILNNFKILETRKWPVLAECKGPIGIHCAFHDWDGIEEAREYVRGLLGDAKAACALEMPSHMKRGAVVGVVHQLGRTWMCRSRETLSHPASQPISCPKSNTHAAKLQGEEVDDELRSNIDPGEQEWIRSVTDSRNGRVCDLVLCQDSGGWDGGTRAGAAEVKGVCLDTLEQQALLRGLEGKCVTPVFRAEWLRSPVPTKGKGTLFPVRIPRAALPPDVLQPRS